MGMNYQFSGSASYPGFEREVYEIVKLFGGEKTEYLKRREEIEGIIKYFFGSFVKDNSGNSLFCFPEYTNTTIVKWINNIYEDLSPEETSDVWRIFQIYPEIKDISPQIWNEFSSLVKCGNGWHIKMMCEYFVCIQSQSYNCGDPDKCREEDCYNCPCDYPLKYGCLICGNYDEYDMICLKNKNRILRLFYREEG